MDSLSAVESEWVISAYDDDLSDSWWCEPVVVAPCQSRSVESSAVDLHQGEVFGLRGTKRNQGDEEDEDEDEDEDEEEDEDEDEEGPWFPEEPMPDEQELRAQIAREKAEIEERRRQFQLHELEQQQQITTTRRVPTIPHPLIWE